MLKNPRDDRQDAGDARMKIQIRGSFSLGVPGALAVFFSSVAFSAAG
jgi:hypothetical protein